MTNSFPSRENLAVLFDEYKNLTKTARAIVMRELPDTRPLIIQDPVADLVQVYQRVAQEGRSNRERREIFAAYVLKLLAYHSWKKLVPALYDVFLGDSPTAQTTFSKEQFNAFIVSKIWQKGAFQVSDYIYDWTTEIVFPIRQALPPERWKALHLNRFLYEVFIFICAVRDKQIKEKRNSSH